MSLVYLFANQYRAGQTNGRGYIGLAAMIFGNWRPGGLALGAGLFGFTDTLSLLSGEATHALLLVVASGLAVVMVPPGPDHRRRKAPVAIVVGGGRVGLRLVRGSPTSCPTRSSCSSRTSPRCWC